MQENWVETEVTIEKLCQANTILTQLVLQTLNEQSHIADERIKFNQLESIAVMISGIAQPLS
jgi:hypothetical protein